MSKAYLKAKEKYNEIINDAGRGDWYCKFRMPSIVFLLLTPPNRGKKRIVTDPKCQRRKGRTNRIAPSRLPSKGKCDAVAHVDHAPSRRGSTGSMTDKIKDWMNRPAY